MSLKEILWRFKPFYIAYFRYFLLAFLGMALAALGTAASFHSLQPILDYIFIEKRIDLLYIVPFFIVFAYLAKNVGLYMQSYYIAYIGTNILKTLRFKVLENLLRLDMEFFKRYRSGELMSRCTNDIGALQSIVSTLIPELLRELMTAIGLISVVIYNSPRLAFFALIVLPCATIPLLWLARKLRKYAKNTQETGADLLSRLGEIFTNIELIKANHTEQKELMKFDTHNERLCKVNLKISRVDALISPTMELIGSLGVALVIVIGGKEVIEGRMSAGAFIAFVSALFALYQPIKKITSLYGRLQTAIVASERTFYLLDLKPEIKGGEDELGCIDEVEFKDVYFAYDEKSVLNGLNLNFKRGEILALVGASGGGKSSIIGLLLHFFKRKSGEILLNHESIDKFSLKSLRLKMALVTQDIYIFNESIAENVAYSEELDEQRVIESLKLANAYEFVEKMGGIYTQLFENGKNLSGGQKQRIAIARALYKNPDLLIFDEATSALDNESERAIVKTIENLKKDRLILLVAHRLSTVENADKIALIDKGKVLACGSDAQLLNTCEAYRKLKIKNDETKL
ncbi:ABC transporter ATP-binding protein [Campylobacter helveticus]|uniref:ABC transporter ATP-binding protein n=1 Tax=Campylobacter helveticus TaxID=28898 RepID=A0ABY3L2K7_9BACT|nr:ABC transporter ATP-binding protein [Campylobacter helveticus]MCR2038788.1 ABC transporter ATP-binding protein/permease [Campylobacter helveticus]MCR2053904.1 ABC transporter ATP-binding protein/permease [Campylobacter helveticus]MCR2055854.1 ABC transporter ATP-binding protein/permease [Campylobacter helveticus]MCR2059476.1 ABC transporter ATP-binding protein/permease [Campylobacter helveticus]MCR2061883.1 ABC transporter ATP-binding protein/permease [Campylobacter helveticus]